MDLNQQEQQQVKSDALFLRRNRNRQQEKEKERESVKGVFWSVGWGSFLLVAHSAWRGLIAFAYN